MMSASSLVSTRWATTSLGTAASLRATTTTHGHTPWGSHWSATHWGTTPHNDMAWRAATHGRATAHKSSWWATSHESAHGTSASSEHSASHGETSHVSHVASHSSHIISAATFTLIFLFFTKTFFFGKLKLRNKK